MPNEDSVIDDIDALIATELDEYGVPLDDYSKDRYPRCELCQRHWHGLPFTECPGAYATDSEREDWKSKQHSTFQAQSVSQYVCQIEGITYRLELHGTNEEGLIEASVQPVGLSQDENYASAYSFSEAASRLMVNAVPMNHYADPLTDESGWTAIGYVDDTPEGFPRTMAEAVEMDALIAPGLDDL